MNQTQSYKDIVVDGIQYRVLMMPADQGLKTVTKLIKIFGEPIANLVQLKGNANAIADALPNIIKSLVTRMNEEEVVDLAKSLASSVTLQGSSAKLDADFNLYFRGRYAHMMKLLTEVAKFNFNDFLDVLPFVKNEGQVEKQA